MKPAPFTYVRPETLDEALALLAEHGDDAAVLAGGQSLMPLLALRMAAPTVVVDINRVGGLDGVELAGDAWRLGARVRHADALAAVAARRPDHLLARALPLVAHLAIRNRGTFGGSLALADPAAELPACAVGLDATIELASIRGTRTVAAEAFFEGLYATARRPDELVLAASWPAPRATTRYAFREVARRHGDYAIVGLAVTADLEGGGAAQARVVAFGAGERPQRLAAAEAALAGGAVTDPATARRAAEAAGETVEIAPDPAYAADYKRRLVRTLVARAIADLGAAA